MLLQPLSLVFGWDIATSFLAGAHDIDRHFVDTNPRHNLPIILSLVDLWNDELLHSRGRIISPHSQRFRSYPGFVAALENKVLNGCASTAPAASAKGRFRKEGPTPVIDGGCHGVYDGGPGRESNGLSVEFIATLDPPSLDPGVSTRNVLAKHDSRMCSLLARADTLAFGGENGATNRTRFEVLSPGSPPMIQSVDSMLSHGSVGRSGEVATVAGNRPNTLIVCESCDAFACGQLAALAEHRALVKAWLWDVNPFVTTTTSVEEERHEYLADKLYQMHHLLSMGEDVEEANRSLFPAHGNGGGNGEAGNKDFGISAHSATRAVLKRYATRMQGYRQHDMPRTPPRYS